MEIFAFTLIFSLKWTPEAIQLLNLSFHTNYDAQGRVLIKKAQFSYKYLWPQNNCIMLQYTILPKVLGHPFLTKGLTTLVISMSTNLNVYNIIYYKNI